MPRLRALLGNAPGALVSYGSEEELERAQAENPRWWLREYCTPEMFRSELVATPFLLDIDGVTYECATDGHGMMAVEGAGVTTRRDGPPGAEEYFAPQPLEIGKADIGLLAQWGRRAECHCDICDPAGANEYRHAIDQRFRIDRLFGRRVDRWLIWRFLHNLKGEVTIRSDEDPLSPLQFFGEGFVFVLMPCRDEPDNLMGPFPPPVTGEP
jgi:hypothetical protein